MSGLAIAPAGDLRGFDVRTQMLTTVALVCSDDGLITAVRDAVAQTVDCKLVTVAAITKRCELFAANDLSLVIYHHTTDDSLTELFRLRREIVASSKPVAILAIGDDYDQSEVADLLSQGVADYLPRPLNLRRLAYLTDVLTIRARMELESKTSTCREQPIRLLEDPCYLLESASPSNVMDQVRRIAPLDTTALLTGETGTGKSRLARLIHDLSPRKKKPFLVVNCGALTPHLIESELFGHVRGAFTGADSNRAGKFQTAGDGTLMLDEIDALSWDAQTRLLRALEDRVFEPVGCDKTIPLHARLITATNASLEEAVASRRFRADLYYRIKVVSFELPPLRERRTLIRPAAEEWVAEFSDKNGRKRPALADDVVAVLCSYDWPGNLRELRNVVERAVALCPGDCITLDFLPQPIAALAPNRTESVNQRTPAKTLFRARLHAESEAIAQSLQRHANNRSRAATDLGISRVTLYKKMHQYGLI